MFIYWSIQNETQHTGTRNYDRLVPCLLATLWFTGLTRLNIFLGVAFGFNYIVTPSIRYFIVCFTCNVLVFRCQKCRLSSSFVLLEWSSVLDSNEWCCWLHVRIQIRRAIVSVDLPSEICEILIHCLVCILLVYKLMCCDNVLTYGVIVILQKIYCSGGEA